MGMLIFLVASGLSLIFGLMDVLNSPTARCSPGVYAGFTAAVLLNQGWGGGLAVPAAQRAPAPGRNRRRRPRDRRARHRARARDRAACYGQHLFQILITLGATIVLEELIRIAWGPNDQVMPVPAMLMGSWTSRT
jgi:branched-chain amino acid transport system permease protein